MAEHAIFDLIDQHAAGVGLEDLDRLGAMRMAPSELAQLNVLDPFSQEYRQICEALYLRISQRSQYNPKNDENSGLGESPDIWRGVTPFSFQASRFMSEFLISWAAIFEALDMTQGQSILEYGPGSGQILLMLARCGMASYGVDIDQDSLAVVRRQSEAMGLGVSLEQNEFGKGFAGQRFDRILFYEAFHHALNFDSLLLGLHDRLKPGGKLLLAGEPVAAPGESAIPYPWGPRMDGLSLFCIRRRGWMELGFQSDFFVKLMMRCGWTVRFQPSPVYRANVYVAEPMPERLMLGAEMTLPEGWSGPEGAHRWTIGTDAEAPLASATITLPILRWKRLDLQIELANFLGESKQVTLIAGDISRAVTLESGQTATIDLRGVTAPDLLIQTSTTVLPNDPRPLGIAVRHCVITPSA